MCWGARQCWVGLLDTWQSVSLHPPSSLRTGLLLPLTEETEHLDSVTPHAASVTRACTSLDGRAGEAGAATGVVIQRELWELQRPLSHPCTVQLSAWLLVLQVKACLYSTSQVCQEACYVIKNTSCFMSPDCPSWDTMEESQNPVGFYCRL